jgi:hypothetical protein
VIRSRRLTVFVMCGDHFGWKPSWFGDRGVSIVPVWDSADNWEKSRKSSARYPKVPTWPLLYGEPRMGCWSEIVLNYSLRQTWSACAVFSLEPLAQDPRNEIMDLRRVDQFTPLPLPCPALHGAWNWSCRGHSDLVVWTVYIAKIPFRWIFRRSQKVPCSIRVLHLCCW